MSKNKKIAALFNSYYASVKNHLLLKYGVGEDADDILQDAFQKLLDMDDIEIIENPKAYLFKAASNLALNRIRRQGYQDDYIASLDQGTVQHCPQRQFLASDDLGRVYKVLANLSDKDRKTFLLNRIHGMSYRQISEELHVTLSTVEKRMMKVLSLLRNSIDE